TRPTPRSTLFPYTTLFRSTRALEEEMCVHVDEGRRGKGWSVGGFAHPPASSSMATNAVLAATSMRAIASSSCASAGKLYAPRLRSEEHTSELQSQSNLVCR